MPLPVPQTPTPSTLRRLQVGRPVLHAHAQRWADELAFLLAYCLPPVASVTPDNYTSSPASLTVFYKPSPYCKALRVQVGVRGNPGATCTIGVSLGSDWINNQAGHLDGSTISFGAYSREEKLLVGYYDATTLTPGTIYPITVTRTETADNSLLTSVNLHEVPLAAYDVQNTPASEPGINPAWGLPPGKLVDGTDALPYGFARIVSELEKARDEVPRHLQLATIEATSEAESTASATFVGIFGGSNAAYRMRARRLYDSTTYEPFDVRVRYLSASADAVLRIIVTPVGGSPTNHDFTLTTSGSFATHSGTIDIDTDGTEQEVDLAFELKVPSGTAYVSTVALISD